MGARAKRWTVIVSSDRPMEVRFHKADGPGGFVEDADVTALEDERDRLASEVEAGWNALGYRRNPQHDVTIADGINRIRARHAELRESIDTEVERLHDRVDFDDNPLEPGSAAHEIMVLRAEVERLSELLEQAREGLREISAEIAHGPTMNPAWIGRVADDLLDALDNELSERRTDD